MHKFSWIYLLIALFLLYVACSSDEYSSISLAHTSPFISHVLISMPDQNKSANRLILGNNIQWVDRGDGLLQDDGTFSKPMMSLVMQMKPSALRYPGGTYADTYHWKNGIGKRGGRKVNYTYAGHDKKAVQMGTIEFLELCEKTGAQPLITVNVVTGSPEEAASWVRYVNKQKLVSSLTGKLLPKVLFWEIGNEPYLHEGEEKFWMKPTTYASKALHFIAAMKKIDPDIKVGIPLRNDTIGGVPATPYQGFNRIVLKAIMHADFDFVSVHNAYFPLPLKKTSAQNIYWATMAATNIVSDSLQATRAQLKRIFSKRYIPIAITEYNALYSFGDSDDSLGKSLMAAIYIADLLRVLAQTDGLVMANYWSLSENWNFGAIDYNGDKRASFHVLQMFGHIFRGGVLKSTIKTEVFNSARVGLVPEQKQVPLLTAISIANQDGIDVMLINKSLQQPSLTSLELPDGFYKKGYFKTIYGESPFNGEVRLKEGNIDFNKKTASVLLPPHSITFVHFN
jgi:alpha-N-arabinofuranosidase